MTKKDYFLPNFVAFLAKKSPKYSIFFQRYYFRISTFNLERVNSETLIRNTEILKGTQHALG